MTTARSVALVRSALGTLVLTGLIALGAPSAATAQSEGPPTPPDTAQADLVFEREVYSYPSFERRDPFSPLVSGSEGAPRYEDLRLLGVIYSTNPTESVALLGVSPGNSAIKAGDTFRVRRGDLIGNTRILAIQTDRVIVEVEEFGLTEQRSLAVKRPGEGGSR